MRIQHNIPAMNSYRNYKGNVSKVSGNLEKLSTGYKINRAGDDAAGLAISEKMRAQITGLEKAQANAKHGISLVQTAEGALTEVHSMLNRMLELADQSANGTYDNTTDRKQLQKEVSALKTEIDRIADSSNFNGIKLLDGSLEEGGATQIEIGGNAKAEYKNGIARSSTVNGLAAEGASISVGDKITINLQADDGSSYTINLEVKSDKIVDLNSGTSYSLQISSGGKPSNAQNDFLNAMRGAVRDATGNRFELSEGGATFKSMQSGSGAAAINAVGGRKVNVRDVESNLSISVTSTSITTKVSAGATVQIKDDSITKVNASTTLNDMKAAIFTINDQKFLLVSTETDLKAVQNKIGDSVTLVYGASISAAAGQLAKATGLTLASTGSATFRAGSGEGLRLQIGDTSDSFNKMDVSIKDMHTTSLGLAGLNIGNQGSAATAVTLIKNAINTVSDVRGGLGAIQNRLDHTINNLSVMQENIQDAESSIRDTDVADEMMDYTKNNILVQSAQAMLAQANQLPQGVLQLLG